MKRAIRQSNSDGLARFTTFRFTRKTHPTICSSTSSRINKYDNYNNDFSQLPYDVLVRISAAFNLPNLRAASLVCKSWCEALRPLRESMIFLKWGKRYKHGRSGVKRNLSKALDSFRKGAALGSTLAMVDAGLVYWEMGKRDRGMILYRKAAELGDPVGQCNLGISLLQASLVCKSWCEALRPLRESMIFLRWGKRYKHGRSGVKRNLSKALDSLLKGAACGSTLAMVDAGLVYWEMGKRDKGMILYRKAAELGDPVGQCNLGISLLQANPPDPEEAVKWLYKASVAGHVRAQYQLALSLHKRHGPNGNLQEAAKWYLRAAEGGYVRAMYNTALCYSVGEGLMQSHKLAKKWMKRAADRGHSKAQLEHGTGLFSEGEMLQAVVYLELASRAGEVTANPVKNVILQQMSASTQDHVMLLANSWRALPSSQ